MAPNRDLVRRRHLDYKRTASALCRLERRLFG
jgi:hypothetical protein